MTTSYNYTATDRAALRAAINTNLSTAVMQAGVSSSWRGWHEASGSTVLNLGAAGSINAQACGAVWEMQLRRPAHRVLDRETSWTRDWSLIIYFRRQADPTDADIVDAFDALVKTNLIGAFDADGSRSTIDFSAHWSVQEQGASWIETAHLLEFQMGN